MEGLLISSRMTHGVGWVGEGRERRMRTGGGQIIRRWREEHAEKGNKHPKPSNSSNSGA